MAKNIGLLEGLTLVFVHSKLAGNVEWSWALVLVPFWVPHVFVYMGATTIWLKRKLRRSR